MRRLSLLIPLAGCILSIVSERAIAAPTPYSTMIVFGDSLSDSGQFPGVGSGMRFTNHTGPTYKEYSGEEYVAVAPMRLGAKLGIAPGDLGPSTSMTNSVTGSPDGNNWAVGGYRTDQILNSVTTVSKVTVPDDWFLIGGSVLRSKPGYLVENNFKADPKALYFISGGGNDFIQGKVTSPAEAGKTAQRLAASTYALQHAGARYIMVWLLPDLGLTPAIYGTPNQAGTSYLSAVFNHELAQQLEQIDAEIIPLNIPLLLREAVADPARYGLALGQDLIGTCFNGDECTENLKYGLNSSTPNPAKLLFNDSVHPTEAGQQLIADYAYSLLAVPWELTLLPVMAQGSLNAHQDQLRNQWVGDNGQWQAAGQWRAMVAGGGQRLEIDEQDTSVSADGRGYNVNIGTSYRADENWRFGVAGGFYRQHLEAGANESDYKLNSYLGSVFAQYQHNHWWGDAALTLGRLDYDSLKRKFAFGIGEGMEQGQANGHLRALSTRLGYDIAPASDLWHLSPFISAEYSRVEVNRYEEKGRRSTALNYEEQTLVSNRLGAGLLASYQATPQTLLFGEAAHEHEFQDQTQRLNIALNSLPNNRFKLEGYTPPSNLARLSLGVSHKLTSDLMLRAAYNARKSDGVMQQGVNVGVSLNF
ncbi:esterase EstP [Pseudomonas kulmbachensis]|uniref:esterase EstP n=1 Tax=Pseudomonas kulmbachensis TaxID=3043408 RepID=UPI002AB1D182|nr:esterase EstP [Pseudomonas sp. V3/3/4/13]